MLSLNGVANIGEVNIPSTARALFQTHDNFDNNIGRLNTAGVAEFSWL